MSGCIIWRYQPVPLFFFFFFYGYGDPRDLHSFPTRRSSDLDTATLPLDEAGLLESGEVPSQCRDRKSTRLNSSHEWNSYAVFCLKKTKAVQEDDEVDEDINEPRRCPLPVRGE